MSVVFCGAPVSSTNKTNHHDIAGILLKVALNTIKQTKKCMKIIDLHFAVPIYLLLCRLHSRVDISISLSAILGLCLRWRHIFLNLQILLSHLMDIVADLIFWFINSFHGASRYKDVKTRKIRNIENAEKKFENYLEIKSMKLWRGVWRYQREVIRIGKSKKDKQHNGQKKKDKMPNNDLQNIHIQLKIE